MTIDKKRILFFIVSIFCVLIFCSASYAQAITPQEIKSIVEDYVNSYLLEQVQKELEAKYPTPYYSIDITGFEIDENSIKKIGETDLWSSLVTFSYTLEKKDNVDKSSIKKDIYVNGSDESIINLGDKIYSDKVWDCAEKDLGFCNGVLIMLDRRYIENNTKYYQNILNGHGINESITCGPICCITAKVVIPELLNLIEYAWIIRVEPNYIYFPSIEDFGDTTTTLTTTITTTINIITTTTSTTARITSAATSISTTIATTTSRVTSNIKNNNVYSTENNERNQKDKNDNIVMLTLIITVICFILVIYVIYQKKNKR